MDHSIRRLVGELKRALEALYGPRLAGVVLFGSWARGDAAPDSDVDVLVILRGAVAPGDEIARTGDIVAALSLETDRVIAPVFISEERYRSTFGPLLRNIAREGVPV
jgi:predicted nucleotidyltransferase